MNKITYLIIFAAFLCTACNDDETMTPDDGIPVVTSDSSFSVIVDENISYANGLSHNEMNMTIVEMPQYLDVYYPDNTSTNRPVFMFIHGGGFQGGTKTKPEIVEMGNYFASRGWVSDKYGHVCCPKRCQSSPSLDSS